MRTKSSACDSSGAEELSRAAASNVGWALAGRVAGIAASVLTSALLARLLTQDDLATYLLAGSAALFAAMLARVGMKQVLVVAVARSLTQARPELARGAITAALKITTIGAAVVSSALYLLVIPWLARSVLNNPRFLQVNLLISLWMMVLAYQTPVAESFRGLNMLRPASVTDGPLPNLLLALALIYVIVMYGQLALSSAIVLSVAAGGAAVSLMYMRLWKRLQELGAAAESQVVPMLKAGAPMLLTAIAASALSHASLWIAGALLPLESVAVFGVAVKLVVAVFVPLTIVDAAVQPLLAGELARGRETLAQRLLSGIASLAAVPALMVLVAFLCAGDSIVKVIYGSAYESASMLVIILSVGQTINVLTGPCGTVLIAAERGGEVLAITLLTGVAAIVITIAAASTFGVVGLASGVSFGTALQNAALWAAARRRTGLWTHATFRWEALVFALGRIGRGKAAIFSSER